MKILFLNPAFDYYTNNFMRLEPLSIGYLAAYLEERGYKIEILDAAAGNAKQQGSRWHYGLDDAEVIEKIKNIKPDLVGINCFSTWRIESALCAAKLVKEISHKIITVLGGIHPTIFPLETVGNENVDYVIIGEGEESFVSLIKHIESKHSASEINVDGCAYKIGNQANLIPKTSFIKNLDAIPFPARHLLPMEFYINNQPILYGLGKQRTASLLTSRSCPKKCTFCSSFLAWGSRWRHRSARNVFEEIKLLTGKYKAKEIFILDDNFTFNKERVMELCELILHNNLKFRWNTPNGIEANSLDEELLTIMKKAGCVNICIGVEAGNEIVRNQIIKKGLPEETIHRTLNICKKIDMPVVGFFILGIPGENKKTFTDTINMVKKFPFSMIATYFFTPLPGTELYRECVDKKYIDKDFWQNLGPCNVPVVETQDFDKNTLRKWKKKIYYEFLKSHFWQLVFKTITLKNEFLKWGLIKRFLQQKFNLLN